MKKSEGENPNNDILTIKNPKQVIDNIMTQRTIGIATATVITNTRIANPVTTEIRPGKGNAIINVANSHKKSFSVMKLVNPTIKDLNFTHKNIDSSDQFLLENYTFIFKEIFK